MRGKELWIVDDSKSFCSHVCEVLQGSTMVRNYCCYYSCESLLENILIKGKRPDIVLLDIQFSNQHLSGLDVLPIIIKNNPRIKVIMMSAFDEDPIVHDALKLGASGFVRKASGPNDMLKAIEVAIKGGTFIEPRKLAWFLSSPMMKQDIQMNYSLTRREKEILRYLIEGDSMKDVSQKIFVSYNTVNFHIKNLHKKLHVKSRGHLIAKALKENLIEYRNEPAKNKSIS
jgi:DNA-binding NarL/FixJ family response regulator